MPTLITARTLLTDIGSVEYPVLTVADDGTLDDIASDPIALAHETDTLTAAFLDVHIHGAVGHDVMSATPAELASMQRFLASRGVAHYLPTTVTAAVDATLRSLEALANAIERRPEPAAAQPIGIHLEGPFLSHAKRGVHPADQLQPPSVELFTRFWQASRGHIKLLTLAPEPHAWLPSTAPQDSVIRGESPSATSDAVIPTESRSASSNAVISTEPRGASLSAVILSEARSAKSKDPATAQPTTTARPVSTSNAPRPSSAAALELITHARSLGVRISLGHTNATAAEARAAITAGATSATHTFNAMRPLDHREPGVLGVTLDSPDLFAELICDGIHVAPELVRLWLRSKTPGRAILVTDAMSATGMPDGPYKLGALDVTVTHGRAVLANAPGTLAGSVLTPAREVLAGSVLTMDRAVANLQRFTHASLADATRCASHTPAAMLGLPELTRLAPGSPANLNRFDAHGRLIATYLRGDLID